MAGFASDKEASEIMSAVVAQMDMSGLESLDLTYSYRFADINWSCTVVLRGGAARLFEGILPDSESTIETTSGVFDKVMSGAMSVVTAHLTNQAQIRGSVGNALTLRTVVPAMSEAYRIVSESRRSTARASDL